MIFFIRFRKVKKASHNLLNTAIDYYNHKYFEKENHTKTR